MDSKAWGLLLDRLEKIEKNQIIFAKKQDKLLEFRGWVLGAACIAGVIGGMLVRLYG